MQLVLNTFGSYLSKEGDCFFLKSGDKRFTVSCKKVEQILITTAATITTDAVKLATDNNIDIIFLDKFGNPYGRVWHSKLGSTVLIRRRQLEFAMDKRGIEIAKEWIIAKFNNNIEFIDKLYSTRKEKGEQLLQIKNQIIELKDKLEKLQGENVEEIRNSIMGYEGRAGKVYFDALNFVMPDMFKFSGRSRMPAKDEFNAMINYGYGVLYSMVEKACIIAGLDPYVGFLHSDNYNKKSLVFDLIELFRYIVDKSVVYLFTGKKVNKNYFDKIKNGITLNKAGKEFFIMNLNEDFEKKVRYRNRNIKLKNTIQFECHRLAQSFIKNKD